MAGNSFAAAAWKHRATAGGRAGVARTNRSAHRRNGEPVPNAFSLRLTAFAQTPAKKNRASMNTQSAMYSRRTFIRSAQRPPGRKSPSPSLSRRAAQRNSLRRWGAPEKCLALGLGGSHIGKPKRWRKASGSSARSGSRRQFPRQLLDYNGGASEERMGRRCATVTAARPS